MRFPQSKRLRGRGSNPHPLCYNVSNQSTTSTSQKLQPAWQVLFWLCNKEAKYNRNRHSSDISDARLFKSPSISNFKLPALHQFFPTPLPLSISPFPFSLVRQPIYRFRAYRHRLLPIGPELL